MSILLRFFGAKEARIAIIHKERATGTASINFKKILKIGLLCIKQLFDLKKALVKDQLG